MAYMTPLERKPYSIFALKQNIMYVCHIKRLICAQIWYEDLFQIVFLINDQPATCGKCGARTDIIFDLSHSIAKTQIHECLNEKCKSIFVMEDDEEFNLEMGNVFYTA